MYKIKYLIFFILFYSTSLFSQVENIPLDNNVYDFLKLMSVKKIISGINDDNPNLSRQQVMNFLSEIDNQKNELSKTEIKLLNKFKNEFFYENFNKYNSTQFIDGDESFSQRLKDIFSTDKEKLIYSYAKGNNNLYINFIGHSYFAKEFKPYIDSNTFMADFGFRASGTLFKHLGYYFSWVFGGQLMSGSLAESIYPALKTNFKFNEGVDKIRSYNFPEAYIKFYTEPDDNLNLSVQLGREMIRYGYGYSNSLTLSGNGPYMDFIKFTFNWGVAQLSSIHASTVGEYNIDRSLNYTKFIALNRLKFSFKNLFNFGLIESIVYSRGIELGYLTPLGFYKLIEMNIQDRDNSTFGFDFQTNFFRNIEFQGTFFLDENIFFNLQELDRFINKTAYQLGTFIYEPFNIKDLYLILEYTKIRPYVYTHANPKINYSAYGVGIGHPIGPNSDQLYFKIGYNFSETISAFFEFQRIRKGNNIIDSLGNVIKNVGGDIFLPHRKDIDDDIAVFLDGELVHTNIFTLNFRFEPFRNFIFDFIYNYQSSNNLYRNKFSDLSYFFIKMTIDY